MKKCEPKRREGTSETEWIWFDGNGGRACDSCRFCSLFIFLPTYLPPHPHRHQDTVIHVFNDSCVCCSYLYKTQNNQFIVSHFSQNTFDEYEDTVVVPSPFPVFIPPPRRSPTASTLSNNIPMKIAIFWILAYPLCTQAANAHPIVINFIYFSCRLSRVREWKRRREGAEPEILVAYLLRKDDYK